MELRLDEKVALEEGAKEIAASGGDADVYGRTIDVDESRYDKTFQ